MWLQNAQGGTERGHLSEGSNGPGDGGGDEETGVAQQWSQNTSRTSWPWGRSRAGEPGDSGLLQLPL